MQKQSGYDQQSGYYRTPKRTHVGDDDYIGIKASEKKEVDDYLVCKNCKGESSLSCIDPPLIKELVLRFGYWLCPDCKICSLCNRNSAEQKMLFCDLCDRGFDLDCLGVIFF